MSNQLQTNKPKSKVSTGVPVRISNETKKVLSKLLDKANKKTFGKKVKPDALIQAGLKLLSDKDIKTLQDNSLSNADRLEMAFKEYKKKHSSASKDDFWGSLLTSKSNIPADENATFSEVKTQQMDV